jgi:hypothetical protein
MRSYYEILADRDDAADCGDWDLVDSIERSIARGEYAEYDDCPSHYDDVGCAGDPGCEVCGYRADCPACIKAAADYAQLVREQLDYADACAASAGDDDVPF